MLGVELLRLLLLQRLSEIETSDGCANLDQLAYYCKILRDLGVKACLRLVLSTVVTLIRRLIEGTGLAARHPAGRDLLCRNNWQPCHVDTDSNHVNVMALIRPGSWETVDCSDHFPGRWNDVDILCSPIIASHHGEMRSRPWPPTPCMRV